MDILLAVIIIILSGVICMVSEVILEIKDIYYYWFLGVLTMFILAMIQLHS